MKDDVPKNSRSRVFMTPFDNAQEAYAVLANHFHKNFKPTNSDPLGAMAEEYRLRFALEHIRIICEMSDAEDEYSEM